jgi:hypothetical protein
MHVRAGKRKSNGARDISVVKQRLSFENNSTEVRAGGAGNSKDDDGE